MAELLGGDESVAGRLLSEHLDLGVLEPGVEYRAQECELLQDTGFRRPVSVSTTPLRTPGDEDDRVLLIVRDVAEVAALRKRLAASERFAVVGQLAGGIAHEINNPLAFVRANLHHLHRELAEFSEKPAEAARAVDDVIRELEEVVTESLEGIDRAMHIVQDVNTFSDAGGDAHLRVDLGPLLDEALGVVRLGLPSGVRMERVGAKDDGLEVYGAPHRLKHLFLNLLVNAVQSVEESGSVEIEMRDDRRRVSIVVTDDGTGIAPEDLARVFDPFFTTRPVGTGPGLGLAVCHEIVRSHGGTIDVKSDKGCGTRVAISLPVRTQEG
jgi:signal transduction histidine kinase